MARLPATAEDWRCVRGNKRLRWCLRLLSLRCFCGALWELPSLVFRCELPPPPSPLSLSYSLSLSPSTLSPSWRRPIFLTPPRPLTPHHRHLCRRHRNKLRLHAPLPFVVFTARDVRASNLRRTERTRSTVDARLSSFPPSLYLEGGERGAGQREVEDGGTER